MPYKEWSRMADAKQVIHHLSVREAWRTQKERVRRGRQRDRVQDLLNELTLPAACLGISSLYYTIQDNPLRRVILGDFSARPEIEILDGGNPRPQFNDLIGRLGVTWGGSNWLHVSSCSARVLSHDP